MSSTTTYEDIARLLTKFNIKIDSLPDDLKCAECKSILKDACQVPCGCRFCRTCVDDVIAKGTQFCPGGSEECCETFMSSDHRDFRANKSISRLTARCPLSGCFHQCLLVDMEGHLRVCPRKCVDCPFREFGCQQEKLTAEEISDHMQQESMSHIEILIGKVALINTNVEELKRCDKVSKEKIEKLECELVLKDDQMNITLDELRHVQNEIRSINDENKSLNDKIESIMREKEVLFDQVRQLSEKLEQRLERDERDVASITAITEEMEPVDENMQLIRNDILNRQVQSKRMTVELGDASCDDWLIAVDIAKTGWGLPWSNDSAMKTSDTFTGAALSYIYQLDSVNFVTLGALCIQLRIWAGAGDSSLEWPFRGAVTVTVAHVDRHEACSRQVQKCRIKKPRDNQYSSCDPFTFRHSDLRAAGLDLGRGVRVSCQIRPGDCQ